MPSPPALSLDSVARRRPCLIGTGNPTVGAGPGSRPRDASPEQLGLFAGACAHSAAPLCFFASLVKRQRILFPRRAFGVEEHSFCARLLLGGDEEHDGSGQ